MLRRSVDGSFKANITRGGQGENFSVDEAIDVLARDCAQTLGLEIAGIDLLFDGDGYRVCEANSNPGFSGFEAATGSNVARRILQHCHWRIRRQLAVTPGPWRPPTPLSAEQPAGTTQLGRCGQSGQRGEKTL
jgi:glutathione synthase/RimK-type ligase-like ATP-grasp enzyme